MMGTDIKLQGGGDVISYGTFDRMVAGKAISIGQIVMIQFVILRIVYLVTIRCYLVEFPPDVM
jgi:hypothetical protein